jgi:hypothetical protein
MRRIKEPEETNLYNLIKEIYKPSKYSSFGKKGFRCHSLREKYIDFYMKNNQLPSLCNNCYKVLIFWEKDYSKENLNNFFGMINSLDSDYGGKFNEEIVIFYFHNKDKMLNFFDSLEDKMQEFNVKGKIDWRKACEKYQRLKPELWKNSKEFIN